MAVSIEAQREATVNLKVARHLVITIRRQRIYLIARLAATITVILRERAMRVGVTADDVPGARERRDVGPAHDVHGTGGVRIQETRVGKEHALGSAGVEDRDCVMELVTRPSVEREQRAARIAQGLARPPAPEFVESDGRIATVFEHEKLSREHRAETAAASGGHSW